MAEKKLQTESPRAILAGVKKVSGPSPGSQICPAKRLHGDETMGTLHADKDRPDLQRLENIVKRFRNFGIGTVALSSESGLSPERICELLTIYFSSVSRNAHPVGPSFGEVWMYTPTMADKAAEHESQEQQRQLERQRQHSRGAA